MSSETDLFLFIFLFFAPLMVFWFIFRRSLADRTFQATALVGAAVGGLSTIPIKILIYPLINYILGVNLRLLVAAEENIRNKILACVGIIGPVEETAKLLGVLIGISSLGMQKRAPAIFLASIAAGIGFSMVENLDYYLLYGVGVLAIRGLVSSTGHVVFSGIAGMALAFSLPTSQSGERKAISLGFIYMMSGLAVAAVFHGLFNVTAFFLPSEASIPGLCLALIFGITLLNYFWTKILIFDSPQKPSHWECNSCQIRGFGNERFCTTCGTRVTEIEI